MRKHSEGVNRGSLPADRASEQANRPAEWRKSCLGSLNPLKLVAPHDIVI
jgi:hypothetical protein